MPKSLKFFFVALSIITLVFVASGQYFALVSLVYCLVFSRSELIRKVLSGYAIANAVFAFALSPLAIIHWFAEPASFEVIAALVWVFGLAWSAAVAYVMQSADLRQWVRDADPMLSAMDDVVAEG
jgi:hypothetical protein